MSDFNPEKRMGFGIETETKKIGLKDHFVVPPFSVLRTTDGTWTARKRAWLSLGIQSEIGRGDHTDNSEDKSGILFKSQNRLNEIMAQGKGKKHPAAIAKGLTFGEMPNYDGSNRSAICGTSIFDPVLCELAYRWWSPENATILDPFAGGSVRGVVAAMLGKQYHGVDLRAEQVEANESQWEIISEQNCAQDKPTPQWIAGDSLDIRKHFPGECDFIFSCPPYGNLEIYSDDPKDLSNMTNDEFLDIYYKIIKRTCTMLKNNRFACFVVGDFRDKRGFYRNFVSDTIDAFLEAGLHYYNEGILLTAIGSLPIRVGKQFKAGRKLGKTHQNILVFYKGDDPKEIKNEFTDFNE